MAYSSSLHASSDHDPLHPTLSPTNAWPCLKLCYRSRTKLCSVSITHLASFSTLLSLVAQSFPDIDNSCNHSTEEANKIELCYTDEDGDTVVIDSDESLRLASLSFQKSHVGTIKLYIRLKNDLMICDNTGKAQTPTFPRRQGRIPCRHFQAGSCRFGSSCTFLHQAPPTQKGDKAASLLSESQMKGQASTSSLQPRVPCRHFQAGSCRFGSSCTFLHQAATRNNSSSYKAASVLDECKNKAQTPPPMNGQLNRPCRQYRLAGACRFGSSCRFLHDASHNKLSDAESGSFLDESEIDKWVVAQMEASEHDNISYFSSPEGQDRLMCILDHPHLPQIAMQHLVDLLTRPKFRTSLLKQATDKIYTALIGSQFLNALHSHIRTSVKPVLECIEPYVYLCEEIMGRTRNGWKEAPLDELKTLVDDVENDSARELSYAIMRLLEHRTKKKRMEAVDEQIGGLSSDSNFRDLPIIPSKEQLLAPAAPSKLPVNQIGHRYPSVAAYLDTHFRLMQEDCIATLRDGIHELHKNSRDPNLHVYTDVRIAGVACGNEALAFRISFNTNARHIIDWQSSKRLLFGSLLCMSCDKFQTFLWAVVTNRTPEHLSNRMVDIQLLEDSNQNALEAGSVYVMAESSAAYFEAYSHVLQNLQRPEMDNLPFQEHLVSLEPRVKEPVYLKGRNREDVYDFECVFPLMKQELRTTQFHILQTWPEWTSSLDESQLSALRHGLTKRLALIQGPPGTGKTFIGLLIVRIMLHNLKNPTHLHIIPLFGKKRENPPEDTVGGPILVICYTNHALDQFLEGIFAHEKNVVRVGRRSKSSELEACNLQRLLRDGKHQLDDLGYEKRNAHTAKKVLEDAILRCTDLVNINHVTRHALHGIATEEQVQSLFYEGCNANNVVSMWLHERERDNRMANNVKQQQSRRHSETSSMHNPFDALAMARVIEEASEAPEASASGISGFNGSENVGTLEEEASIRATSKHVKCDSLESDHGEDPGEGIDNVGNNSNSFLEDLYQQGDPSGGHFFYQEDDNENISRGGKQNMKMLMQRDEGKAEIEPADSAWTEVKAKRLQPHIIPGESAIEGEPRNYEGLDAEELVEMLKAQTDVWSLDGEARRMLHAHWIHTIRHEAQEDMTRLSREYKEACRKKQEIENEIQLSILRTAKVVGMTTTAAARHHSILQSLRAEVIIVEEAAEVLESHILACITTFTKHLILIGDHLQLRPTVAVHNLAVKHHLDVSLFERLVRSGIEYVTLEVQRRMRPSISKLISGIYPMLKDHESVSTRENIKGIKSNVFFFHHTTPEGHRGDDELGKVNEEEAKLVVELCDYFIKQGYTYTDITILSMYRGQTQEIIRRLARKILSPADQYLPAEKRQKLPRVSSVDDYQGEECKIIILSLVRSNSLPSAGTPGKIGFLAVSNRVCVALSRARNGLYMFGNGELLSEKSELWGSVIRELQKSTSYGDALILACQNHPHKETEIRKPSDFQNAPDGGCDRPCEHQLECGHVCPKRCHPGDHDQIVCPKRCPHRLPLCNHLCQSLCHGFDECPPCHELVVKQLPLCGHSARVQCSTSVESVVCEEPCPKVLSCSHKCRSRCGRACTIMCKQLVERVLPCGHSVKIACHIDPLTYLCPQPCKRILPDCQHTCLGTCGTCKQGIQHIPCQQKCNRTLPCGHTCLSLCHMVCPPCSLPCQKSCPHSRCPKKCGYPCVPCMEPCVWSCKHHKCRQLCHELCNRPNCNEPCEKVLGCGHPCLGLCGEPCPPICRICTPGFRDAISLMVMEDFEESDRFLQLQDCSHVFEISGLDTWMQTEQAESGVNGISPKRCPECRRPITRSLRYGNYVKDKHCQIEKVKKRILEFEMTNEGIRHLQERDYEKAAEKFVAAIEKNDANFEARYGLGKALCCQSRFSQGICFFDFVVRHSPLASAVKEVKISKPKETLFPSGSKEKLDAIIEKTVACNLSAASKANKELAMRALVQWASALSNMGHFPDAIKLCETALKEEPTNEEAGEAMRLARESKKIQMEVVEAMVKEIGGRGHWYQCPNGHVYVVGECGGPMQTSVCPDCKATVGGQNHAPAAGNTHASIDGSTHSAWSDHVGLGNFHLE